MSGREMRTDVLLAKSRGTHEAEREIQCSHALVNCQIVSMEACAHTKDITGIWLRRDMRRAFRARCA